MTFEVFQSVKLLQVMYLYRNFVPFFQIKLRAQKMAEMDAFLKRRVEDEFKVSEKIETLQTSLQK